MRRKLLWMLSVVPLLLLTSVVLAQNQSTYVYVNTNSTGANSVLAYSLAYDGTLTSVGTFSTNGNGSGLGYFASDRIVAGGPSSNCLYASNDGSNTITAFAIDPGTGSLSLVQVVPSAGIAGDGLSLAATSDGQWLYAANAFSSSVVGFQIDPLGVGACNLVQLFPAISVSGNPLGMKTTADAAYLFVVSNLSPHGDLYWWSIDPSSGSLTPGSGSPLPVRLEGGPSGVAAGVDITCAEDLVAVGEGQASGILVDIFDFDPTSGSLTADPASPLTGNSSINTNVVQFSSDDNNLFVPGQNSTNVSSFTTHPLGFLSTTPDGYNRGPSSIACDGSGQFAVTANSNTVSSYIRRLLGDLDFENIVSGPLTTGVQSIAIWPPKCNN